MVEQGKDMSSLGRPDRGGSRTRTDLEFEGKWSHECVCGGAAAAGALRSGESAGGLAAAEVVEGKGFVGTYVGWSASGGCIGYRGVAREEREGKGS